MQLTKKQQRAFDAALSGKSIFITGPGGVGKSVVVRAIEAALRDRAVLAAPTGVAAVNIGGTTLHRLFRLPLGIATTEDAMAVSKKAIEVFGRGSPTTALIIDEISMVRADVFYVIDHMLRSIRQCDKPFGGLQLILVGDFFQLPPVLVDKEAKFYNMMYKSLFCFGERSWRELDPEVIVLDEVIRQEDKETVEVLNNIRYANATSGVINWVNNKCGGNPRLKEATTLCTTNKLAQIINEQEFRKLKDSERKYYGYEEGDYEGYVVDKFLSLKKGTKVVICANSLDGEYSNGDSGVVEEMGGESVTVVLNRTGLPVDVEKFEWQNVEYEVVDGRLVREVVGRFIQIPLKLGYAITIHKSQGMTLDACHIDLGKGAFAHGQTYVAFSRVRDFDRLSLAKPLRAEDLILEKDVINFYKEYLK